MMETIEEQRLSVTGLKCGHCGSIELILDKNTRELVCVNCGHILLTENIERRPEWRSFEGERKSRARVGLPPTLLMHDKGLSTVIGSEGEVSAGRRIGKSTQRDLKRLRKWQSRISVYSSMERNLSQAVSELNNIGERLGIPRDVLEHASYIYRLALERGFLRGRAINSIAAAALYASLRYYNIPRTLKELSKVSSRGKTELARDYRLLVKELKLRMPVVDPIKYVRRISSRGGLSKRVAVEAEKIIRLAQKRKITAGKDPIGLAAAAVHYACVLLAVTKTQEDIAVAADISVVTVRNRYKTLRENLGLKETLSMEELVEK